MSTRDHGRAAEHYSALLAQARTVQVTADHYQGMLASLREQLAAEIADSDYLPRGFVPRDSDSEVF